MEAVVCAVDRAPDRLAGVVDQDVDGSVLLERFPRHPVDVVGVAEIAAVNESGAAEHLDLALDLLELVG